MLDFRFWILNYSDRIFFTWNSPLENQNFMIIPPMFEVFHDYLPESLTKPIPPKYSPSTAPAKRL